MIEQNIYTNEFLNLKRLQGDPSADEFIEYVFSDPARKLQLQNWLKGAADRNKLDLHDERYAQFSFIRQAGNLPAWADPKLMKAGSAFFVRHSTAIMSLLGLLSLPYCYTAANGAMVLYLSELIKKQTTKRLYDTAIFVWQVMAPDAFSKTGNAYDEILKVRIMHAAVRYYTARNVKWDNAWGLPINQEDMAGTNLSFSLIVIRGLRALGVTVSHAEQEAFIHLWAIVGYLTGLDDDLIAKNTKMGQKLDTAIKHRQFCSAAHGRELTQALIEHIVAVNKNKASPGDIKGLMKYLLGHEIADMLAITGPVLPGYKIALIKTINLIKGFKPAGNINSAYQEAYTTFKKQKAIVD